jgi:diacylglycerol kinase family enzyme
MVTVLLNPAAAGVDQRKPDISKLFMAAGSEARVIELQPGQNPAEAARSASADTSIVIAGGGDGTVSGVAAGLLDTPAVLGVLPLGTLNHFAKDLAIPMDLEKAIAAILTGRVARIDVGLVNDRVFVNNSSIGIYPGIVEAREELRRAGHRKWVAFAMATFRFLRHYRGVVVKIDTGSGESVRRTPFVFVGNNEYELNGRRLGSRARLDAGRLFTYLAPRVRTRELPMLLARALLGRGTHSGAFEVTPATELRVHTPHSRRVRVALDGEITTMTTPLHYRVRPGALKVLLPSA